MDQVNLLICKLNNMVVSQIFNRLCVHYNEVGIWKASEPWVWWMWTIHQIIGVKPVCYTPQAVLKHMMPRDFILKKSVFGTCCVATLPRKKKCSHMALFHTGISIFHVILHYFQKENFSIWVTSGSNPSCYVGHWVKWINKYDPLSTLFYVS